MLTFCNIILQNDFIALGPGFFLELFLHPYFMQFFNWLSCFNYETFGLKDFFSALSSLTAKVAHNQIIPWGHFQ